MIEAGNLFADIPDRPSSEHVTPLLASPHARIERIVSYGHASPPGFWYDQPDTEWVVLLAGAAEVRLEAETGPRTLRPGDHLVIPAHVRHRVEWTAANEPTIWLAVHCG